MLHQGTLCPTEAECPDHVFTCQQCGHSLPSEPEDGCTVCGASWKSFEVAHGPNCPKNILDEAMDSANGALVRRCFRILNAKQIGLTITLADITEEEFLVLELIEAERQEKIRTEDSGVKSFPEAILRALSRRK